MTGATQEPGQPTPGDRTGIRHSTANRLRAVNAAGLFYGAIVAAGTIAVVSGHTTRGIVVPIAVGGVLVTYWLAHVYVAALVLRFGADSTRLTHHLRHTLRHESTVLLGGVPALLVFSVEVLLGVEVETAGDVALWTSVGLLGAIGYVGAYTGGLRGGALILETCVASLFGVAAILLKGLLH